MSRASNLSDRGVNSDFLGEARLEASIPKNQLVTERILNIHAGNVNTLACRCIHRVRSAGALLVECAVSDSGSSKVYSDSTRYRSRRTGGIESRMDQRIHAANWRERSRQICTLRSKAGHGKCSRGV